VVEDGGVLLFAFASPVRSVLLFLPLLMLCICVFCFFSYFFISLFSITSALVLAFRINVVLCL